MTNGNEEQKEAKQLKHDSEVEPTTRSDSTTQKNNSLFTGLTFIIAIAAIIIAVYTIQLNQQLQQKLVDEKNALATQMEQLKQTQSTTQEQIDIKAEGIQQNHTDLQSKLDSLNKQWHSAMSQRLYQNQDWLLLKARYYLELGQINTFWSDNFKATIALLQQADDLLKQVNEPKIMDVRQAIAKEISALKATPTVDVAGLLSQLDAAQISVSNLTIQSTIDESETEAQTETPKTPNPSAWRTRLQDSVNLLEKLVVIRRDDEDIKPLMSPLFESILRESIRLNLQEAQWAILNNNPVVYELALKQAIMNIKRTFNEEAQNTSALIKQIKELQQIKLTQEKPVIGQALPLLNQLIDSKEVLVKQVTNGGKGDN